MPVSAVDPCPLPRCRRRRGSRDGLTERFSKPEVCRLRVGRDTSCIVGRLPGGLLDICIRLITTTLHSLLLGLSLLLGPFVSVGGVRVINLHVVPRGRGLGGDAAYGPNLLDLLEESIDELLEGIDPLHHAHDLLGGVCLAPIGRERSTSVM